jgi:hypothetical protein
MSPKIAFATKLPIPLGALGVLGGSNPADFFPPTEEYQRKKLTRLFSAAERGGACDCRSNRRRPRKKPPICFPSNVPHLLLPNP